MFGNIIPGWRDRCDHRPQKGDSLHLPDWVQLEFGKTLVFDRSAEKEGKPTVGTEPPAAVAGFSKANSRRVPVLERWAPPRRHHHAPATAILLHLLGRDRVDRRHVLRLLLPAAGGPLKVSETAQGVCRCGLPHSPASCRTRPSQLSFCWQLAQPCWPKVGLRQAPVGLRPCHAVIGVLVHGGRCLRNVYLVSLPEVADSVRKPAHGDGRCPRVLNGILYAWLHSTSCSAFCTVGCCHSLLA